MIYLADTHILLWAFFEPGKISTPIRDVLENEENDITVSQVSIWEISLKYSIGKLKMGDLKPDELEDEIADNDYHILQLKSSDLFDFYKLPLSKNRDPFDRLIIWQCIKNGYTLLSRDGHFDEYRKNGLVVIN